VTRTKVSEGVAEFIGAFAIVFVGSGSIMMNTKSDGTAGLLAAAICYAFVVAALVAGLANISAHFNPAVTCAFVATGRTKPMDGLYKIAAQLSGALIGAVLLSAIFPADLLRSTRVGGTSIALGVTFGGAVTLEAVTTALLLLTILGVSDTEVKPPIAGLLIGLMIGALIMAIGPLTGASFNPARSFGPAFASGIWEAHAAYWIGPISGAVGGALIWDFLLKPKPR
jgi:MIP family channel proteins